MAKSSDDETADVEVYDPDAPRDRLPGGIEPLVRSRGRLPQWAKWVGGSAAAALVLAIVVASSSIDEPGPEPAASGTTTTASTTPTTARLAAADGSTGNISFAEILGAPDISTQVATASGTARVWLPDGTVLHVRFPPDLRVESAEVSGIEGFVAVAGGEHCCARHLFYYPDRIGSFVDTVVPIVELHAGEPELGAVYTSQGRQLLVFRGDAGEALLIIAATPNLPFTPAELALYRDTLEVIERSDGFLQLAASGPVQVWTTHARVETTGDPRWVVTMLHQPGVDCGNPTPFVSRPADTCVDGRQLFTSTGSPPDDGAEISVEVTTPRKSVLGPLFGTIAGNGDANLNTVATGEMLVVAGGEFSGSLVGVDVSSGAVVWHRATATNVQLSPFTRSGLVYAAATTGPVAAVEATTGRDVWTLPLARNESPRAFALVDMSRTEPLLVVPSSVDTFATNGSSSLSAVSAVSGLIQWRLEFPGRRMQRWEPLAAAEIVVVGDAVFGGVGTNQIHGIDAMGGVVKWTYETDLIGFRETTLAPQLGPGGVVVVQSDDHRITALGLFDGTILWEHDAPGLDTFGASPDGHVVILAAGQKITLDIGSGEPIG